jgi:Domain of unknown function (DUF4387)
MMPAQESRLRDLAAFIRSKNAGPFMLTIDVFFAGPQQCHRVQAAGALTPETVAALYRVDTGTVKVVHVPQANAIKVSLPRPAPAGEVGERDVAGGQQFAPLLNIRIP